MGKRKEKRINIVSLTDWHIPYHCWRSIDVAFEFCNFIQPDIIIIHEAHDFYALSHFDKDPERANKLQDEIDEVNKYFWGLRKICPKSRIILLKSNHLDRLRKYLWHTAPALSSLRSLNIDNLLELKEHRIEYSDSFEFRNVLFKHGDVVRKYAGYTAKGEFEKEGMSGVSGHTHRLSTYYHTLRGGKYVWIESGCLCKLDAEYIDGTANWMNGLSLVSFDKDSNHFHAEAIPIIDGELRWGNITFKV